MEFVTVTISTVWAWLTWTAGFLLDFQWYALIDIAIMACIVYQAYVNFRGTRAMRVLAGIAILGLGFLLAQMTGLFLTSWLLGGVWAAALIFVIVIFQGEIRDILERLNLKFSNRLLFRGGRRALDESSTTFAQAVFALAAKRWGALFVFERDEEVEPLLRSPGTLMNAELSAELIETIFTPLVALHDGAVYVREGRIYRAGCVLPLSENRRLASFYGTRHRAALGIAEQSDALVVVVSEERGVVSVVENDRMTAIDSVPELQAWLTARLGGAKEHPRGGVVLKSFFTHNWQIKLSSLAAVFVLWFVLVGRQDTEAGISVPVVYYNIPDELTIDDNQAQQVYIRVRGSEQLVGLLDREKLRVAIDLKDRKSKIQRHNIAAKDINLPLGIDLIDVYPSQIWLTLREKPSPGGDGKK